jgi:hypothetical protein
MENGSDDYLDRVRREHREYPQVFFVEILQNLWGDHTEEQTLLEWNRLCGKTRWYAEDALECLDKILASPPPNLAELMQEEGSIMLDNGNGRYTVLSLYRQQYLEWLKNITKKFRVILENSGKA